MTQSAATEIDEAAQTESAAAIDANAPHHGFLSRLYTGTGAFEVVGRRRMWYLICAVMILVAVGSMGVRGFNFGIDFEGGTTVAMPVGAESGHELTTRVSDTFAKTLGHAPETVVVVGQGNDHSVQIRSETLNSAETDKLKAALDQEFHPKGPDGKSGVKAISDSAVSSTWGGQITQKALIALGVFVVIVALYIAVRYERYMAVASLASLAFDLIMTAGVYSLIGFEVTPATVIGLLTILGFSLYDTVIVFDKVEENTHGFEHTTRRTFAEQANLAVNQTFMRSINTSLISALPIISLMVVAVWLLGVGTLKDLALVQLVGVVVGTFSSIFFATPLLVSLRERTDLVKKHTRRVLNRRKAAAERSTGEVEAEAAETAMALAAPEKPEPGAKPIRPGKRTNRR